MSASRRTPEGRLELVYGVEFPAGKLADLPVRLKYAEVDGRWICATVEIGADFDAIDAPDPKPVTTSSLRFALASAIWSKRHEVAQEARRRVDEAAEHGIELPLTAEIAQKAGGGSKRRPGRPPHYGDAHWAEVAEVYNGFGGWARTKAVAEHFGVSKATAAKWVAQCRNKLGTIPPWNQSHGE